MHSCNVMMVLLLLRNRTVCWGLIHSATSSFGRWDRVTRNRMCRGEWLAQSSYMWEIFFFSGKQLRFKHELLNLHCVLRRPKCVRYSNQRPRQWENTTLIQVSLKYKPGGKSSNPKRNLRLQIEKSLYTSRTPSPHVAALYTNTCINYSMAYIFTDV